MGTVINLDTAADRKVAEGVTLAPLIGGAARQLEASLIRLAPAARYRAEVPHGSDQYLFVLAGEAVLGEGGASTGMAARSFAVIEEGRSFTLTAGAGATKVLSVVVPPAGAGASLPGFRQGCKVSAVRDLPVVDVPAEKKRRIYLAGKEAIGSERGHAMIVEYTGDTVTKKHHHPNAESMFIFLDGRVRFLVNGEEVVLGPGEAVHFPMNDSHGLRSADGGGLSFLELHIPGSFTTRYDA